jgi:hypothetical protein
MIFLLHELFIFEGYDFIAEKAYFDIFVRRRIPNHFFKVREKHYKQGDLFKDVDQV